jgi:hypothetical protein
MSLFYLPPGKRHFYLALTVRVLPACHLSANSPPFTSRHEKSQLDDPTTPMSAYALPQHTDPCHCAHLTHAHPHDFQNSIGGRTSAHPALVIAAAHGFAFRLTLDALCAVDVCWPRPTPCWRCASGRQRIWECRHGSSETRRCCKECVLYFCSVC